MTLRQVGTIALLLVGVLAIRIAGEDQLYFQVLASVLLLILVTFLVWRD